MRLDPPWALVAVLTVVTMGLAGCVTDDGTDEAEHRLYGAFSDWDEAIEKDFYETTARYTDDVALMESFPPQFSATGLTAADCAALRAELAQKEYFATLGDCEAS